MKVAFVLGFFDPPEKALSAEFAGEMKNGSLVFLGKSSSNHAFDFKKFKSRFFQVATNGDMDPILVIFADVRGDKWDWVRDQLKSIVEAGRAECSGRDVTMHFFSDAQKSHPIIDALHEFELKGSPDAQPVSEVMLIAHLNRRRVLCVRTSNQTSYEEALRRAGFEFQRFDEHFVDLKLEHSANVANTIKDHAKNYGILLYAWGELKYLPPAVRKKWKFSCQGKTPAAVIARFKQAVLGSSESYEGDAS